MLLLVLVQVVAMEWLTTFFAGWLEWEAMLCLADLVLAGFPDMLLRVALVCLRLLQSQLMQVPLPPPCAPAPRPGRTLAGGLGAQAMPVEFRAGL